MSEQAAAPPRYVWDMPQTMAQAEQLSAKDIRRFLKRFAPLILALAALGAGLAGLYAWTATPIYGAKSQILIESRLPQALREQLGEAGAALDSPAIESQIALLRSGKIVSDVVEKLELDSDPEFGAKPATAGPIAKLMRLFRAPPPPVQPDATSTNLQRELTVAVLQNNIDIRRYGLSYVLDIGVNSRDPEKASKIVNALSEAFMADQLNLKIDAAKQASEWREEQIGRLRVQMNKASRAVQEYKARRDYRLPSKADEPAAGEAAQAPASGDHIKETPATRRDAVTLEELEVTAQAYRKIYELNLQAHADAVLRQSLQFTNARIITTASVPRAPAFPQPRMLMMVGALAGAMLGLAASILRHTFDAALRTPDDVAKAANVTLLATIPAASSARRWSERFAITDRRHHDAWPAIDLAQSANQKRTPFGRAIQETASSLLRLQRTQRIVTIGLTGLGSPTSRSLLAANVARAIADCERKVLLVDCDWPHRAVTQSLAPDAAAGIVDVIAGTCRLDEALVYSPDSNIVVLPAGGVETASMSSLGRLARVQPVLQSAVAMFDIVIVDMPNVLEFQTEATLIAPQVDAVVCIVDYGVTTGPELSSALSSLRNAGIEPAGVILYGSDDANH